MDIDGNDHVIQHNENTNSIISELVNDMLGAKIDETLKQVDDAVLQDGEASDIKMVEANEDQTPTASGGVAPQTENTTESVDVQLGVVPANKHSRHKTKADLTLLRALIIEDIQTNGPRNPIEIADQYEVTEAWVTKEMFAALQSGELPPSSPIKHTSQRASFIGRGLRDLLGITDKKEIVRIKVCQGEVKIKRIRN